MKTMTPQTPPPIQSLIQRVRTMPLYLLYLMGILVSLALAWALSPSDSPKGTSPSQTQSMDTYIPDGFVLVPIEVANYESLDLVIGKFGVVDLYPVTQKSKQDKEPKPLAKAIKILRSSLNPSLFAVLAPDDQAHLLVKHLGPFQVIVQNPQQIKKPKIKKEPQPKRRIIIGNSK